MTALNGPILFNSSSGSDTQASGCGPSSAVFGTTGTCSSGSNVVTGINTTGVNPGDLFWGDTSSGRQFSVIATVDSGTQVTLDDNLAANHSGNLTWAIGGKRATIGNADSKKLFDNGGSTGDIKSGWLVEMESGHVETIASTFNIRVGGSSALYGTKGAATPPVISFSNNGSALEKNVPQHFAFKWFEVRNTNATKTASVAFATASVNQSLVLEGIKVSHASDYFWKGYSTNQGGLIARDCEIGYCADIGIQQSNSSFYGTSLYRCYIHDCGGDGFDSGTSVYDLQDCIFYNNAGKGADLGGSYFNYPAVSYTAAINRVVGCFFVGNGSHGLDVSGTGEMYGFLDANIFWDNGGYGLNLASTDAGAAAAGCSGRHNAFGGNTSGDHNPSSLPLFLLDSISLSADPFVDAAGGDFNINNDSGGGASLRATTLTMPG